MASICPLAAESSQARWQRARRGLVARAAAGGEVRIEHIRQGERGEESPEALAETYASSFPD